MTARGRWGAVVSLALGLGWACASVAVPLAVTGMSHPTSLPDARAIELESDTLDMHPRQQQARASGNVVVRGGGYTLTCDEGLVWFADGGRRVPSRLELQGDIRLERASDGLVLRAGKAAWTRVGGKIELDDDPQAERAGTQVTGSHVSIDVASGDIEVTAPRWRGGKALQLQSDRATLRNGARSVRASGHVDYRDEHVRLRSEVLDVDVSEEGEVASLRGHGGVVLTRGGQRATARRLTFDPDTQVLLLEGEASLDDAGGTVVGERIRIDRRTGVATAERARARVPTNAAGDGR